MMLDPEPLEITLIIATEVAVEIRLESVDLTEEE